MAEQRSYSNDQWTLDLKTLGYEGLAQNLAHMALLCQPPFAACVAGRWGSGKTSIMRYAMSYLGGELPAVRVPYGTDEARDRNFGGGEDLVSDIRKSGKEWMTEKGFIPLADIQTNVERRGLSRVSTLWFSPWRFQNEDNPMVPLLHTLHEQFSTWLRFKASLGKVARATVEAGLEILGNLVDTATSFAGLRGGRFGQMGKAMKQAIERVETQRFETATDTERFNLLFEYAVKSILGVALTNAENSDNASPEQASPPDDHRLVIFIDDLDRCEGDIPLRLLEAIKLYLSTRYCVFILGLDVAAIEHAITGHWTHNPLGTAREYLDKMFQTYVHVPVSQQYPGFIRGYLDAWGINEPSPIAPEPPSDSPPETTDNPPEPTFDPADVIADILPPNPRKVKNFLNSLHLAWKLAQDRALHLALDLARFAIIERMRARAPRAFLLLCQYPELYLETFARFIESCLVNDPITVENDVNQMAVFLHDFRHLAQLDEKWSKESFSPEHGLRDVVVQIDRLKADRALLRHFVDMKLAEPAQFCRYTGIAELGQ